MKNVIALGLFLVLAAGVVSGQTKLTPAAQKASDMVKSGIAYFKDKGKDAALAAFSDPKGKFRDGEYYLFAYDFSKEGTAVCVARGDGNLALVGKDMWSIKDPNGTFYYQDFVRVAKTGSGWVDYKRTNPESKKIEEKRSFIERIPNTTLLVGCGFYKD